MTTRHPTPRETPLTRTALHSQRIGAEVDPESTDEGAGEAGEHDQALQDEEYFQRGALSAAPLRHAETLHLAEVIHGAQTLVLSVLTAGILAVCGLLWASLLKLNDVAAESAATKLALKDMRDELKATNEKVQRMWFEGGWELHRAKLIISAEKAASGE